MSIIVDKPDTMQNEPIEIGAHKLKPNEVYTFKLTLSHNYGTHRSSATFRSDDSGVINLAYMSPLRGSYQGIDAMGLFLSIAPCEDFAFGGYLRCTPPIPFYYLLQLLDASENIIDQTYIKKHWCHPNLERTELETKDFGFCGTLFRPPGKGPFPCIMDLSGTGGGIHEHKGAMLASEGFVVLCCAFFQYKDLPFKMEDADLNYFNAPIDFLLSRDYTSDILGIQGVSFGATIVDLLATRHGDRVKAVVSINGPCVVSDYVHMKENGKTMPHLSHGQVSLETMRFRNGILLTDKNFQYLTKELTDETEIPWGRIPTDVKMRVIGSVDDTCSPSVHTTLYRQKRLKETGHDVELVNGGHIMEPPYFPHHELVYAKFQGFYCGYGGEIVLHAKSQEKTWANTIAFFKRALGAPAEIPDWKRLKIVVPPKKENEAKL
ncbi:unnamed protein product [Caenorhabditis angaria]|uniref:BAAT/Acyl-CoA thioester hydrolase C-terminal domain-containing protein n=1 Tax=Caenorhabditis angaria TaxID=860376 RepID=A0A9P1I7Y9_9PELO|nr:unnamed protein product [Caenorhabditis angaria]